MRYFRLFFFTFSLSGLLFSFSPIFAQGATSPDTTAEQRLEMLDQKVRILERRWELEQENAAAKARETPDKNSAK